MSDDRMQFELDLWRATSLDLDATPFLLHVEPTLKRSLPGFEAMSLWRLDGDAGELWRIGAVGADAGSGASRRALSEQAMRAIVAPKSKGRPSRARHLQPDEWADTKRPPTRVFALIDAEGVAGVAALWASSGSDDAGRLDSRVAELTEPLAVVVRHHEALMGLRRRRDAAVAERDAALARLNRTGLADELVGADGGLSAVLTDVERVASLDVPVLLLGETGAGKEVISRTIHQLSRRSSGPMVRVNCGAIPPELVDSELFGHERGSFTGAVNAHAGWFERADGGTLLLDEVGDLPAAAQVRLLRVLQDGEVTRVGGQRGRSVDVRIIAATHRDLEHMVAQGTFRQDLWFRLSIYPIRIPPLRERLEDLPALARFFSARSARRLGAPPIEPTDGDIDALLSYDWPGNVREFAAVIERAVILGEGRHLEVERALGRTHIPRGGLPSVGSGSSQAQRGPTTNDLRLDSAMRRHILAVLQNTAWRIEGRGGAADLLGLRPSTLRSKLVRLGLERPPD